MAAHRTGAAALGVLSALALTAATQAGYVETWNAPGAGANQWFYFDKNAPNDGDVPLAWTGSGGVDPAPSGYVGSNLGNATTWNPTGAGNYFVAYTYQRFHHLDLGAAPGVSIALSDPGGLNLGGGTLRFWIGEYVDTDGGGPALPTYSFYFLDRTLSYGSASWVTNTIDIADYSWTQFANQNGRPVTALLDGPQQWGIGLFGATSAPSGTLALDNFVPAPAPLALIALGLAGLGWTRRRAAVHPSPAVTIPA